MFRAAFGKMLSFFVRWRLATLLARRKRAIDWRKRQWEKSVWHVDECFMEWKALVFHDSDESDLEIMVGSFTIQRRGFHYHVDTPPPLTP